MKRLAALLITFLLAACGASPDTVRDATPPLTPPSQPGGAATAPQSPYPAPPALPSPRATAYPLSPGGAPVSTPVSNDDIFRPLRPARDFLAEQLGLPAQEIQVAAYEPADFPDGCLGLPRPGEMCIQVITPGYVVTFHTVKGDFTFHVAKSGTPFRLVGGGQTIQDK